MSNYKGKFDHLINNLERISSENSIFNEESEHKAFLSLNQGNLNEWLDKLLPNTRLVIEPKIMGTSIVIQYINGQIIKAFNKNRENITNKVKLLKCIPENLPINKNIEIGGVVYDEKKKSIHNNHRKRLRPQQAPIERKGYKFCAFQIFHCKINHFEALKELKNLNFEIPQTEFTNFNSDIHIYRQYWKEGKLFKSYPTNGIVAKINSRKLQKYIEKNNLSIHWAFAIN